MILRVLQLLLILAIARAVWKLVKGVMQGAGYLPADQPAKVKNAKDVRVNLVRDPVCGTFVSPATAAAVRAGGHTIYFCSEKCQRDWERQR